MLTADPEEIARAARMMVISHGPRAVDLARERVQEAGRPGDIRQTDLALMVLSAVEKLALAGPGS